MSGRLFQIRSADDVIRLVEDIGFLPFFENHIAGFSVEECCRESCGLLKMQTARGNGRGPLPEAADACMGSFMEEKRVL